MRELSIVLRYAEGQRYLARIRAASRVREVFAASLRNGFAVAAGGASQRVRAQRSPMTGSASLEG